MKYFEVDRSTGEVSINDASILLIKEFKALVEKTRNITKDDKKGEFGLLAQKEFAFMYLYID